ncbi:MAG TPA: VWA domain-containing protein [Terriglobales bacterium]|nr:VWA domain-containing protein [Terriglobales bacterium]
MKKYSPALGEDVSKLSSAVVTSRAIYKSALTAVLFSLACSVMECQQDVLRLRRITDEADSCVLLQRDGRYHLERVGHDKVFIAEGILPSQSLKGIEAVLNNDELGSLSQDSIPIRIVASSRDELDVRIARKNGWQKLLFPDAESREPLGKSLHPLLQWLSALPGKDALQLREGEGKTNCLRPRSSDIRLSTRALDEAAVPITASQSPVSPYLMRIVMDRLGGGEAKRTCAIVYPNGFYRLEKSRQAHYDKGFYQPDIVTEGLRGKIKADVFEQFLDAAAITELRRLLDSPDLTVAHPSGLPAGGRSTDSEVTFVLIPRGRDVQRLTFTNYYVTVDRRPLLTAGGGSDTRHMDSAAGVLIPLQKWVKENVESRKAARLNQAVGNNCVASPNQDVPSEISSELAQVVPSDLDSAPAEEDQPIPSGAQAGGSSPAPGSPTAPTNLAGQKTAESEPAISLRVTTRMVLVDVIATDKDGKPIRDLHHGDFEVLEEGRPQEIKFFSYTANESVRNEKRPTATLPPNVYSNRPDSSRPAGPLVLILLDGVNTAGLDQAYARRQLLDYVRTLKSDQQVAIVALTSDLLLLQDFTTDPQVLKAALEKYRASDSTLLARGVPAQISPQMAELLAWRAPALLSNLKRMNQEAAVNSTDDRVRVTIAALQALARAMIGYPGRKNLIWVSSGFPLSLQLGGKNFALSQTYAGDLAEASKLLSQAQVSVYPVDARGLIANLQQPPGSPGSKNPFDDDPPGSQIVPTVESLSDGSYGSEELTRIAPLVTESHMAMQQIAQDTGGRAFYDANNLSAAVARGVADGNSYYTLGYYPQNKDWDGKFRKIAIKTERKDIRLRNRSGYYALDSAHAKGPAGPRPEQERVKELLRVVGDPLPATGVTFSAQVIPPGWGETSSYVEFLVDANTLSWTATGDHYACNLDYAVFTVVPNGRVSWTTLKTVQTSIPASTYNTVGRQRLKFRMPIAWASKQESLRLAVRDNGTGLVGTLGIPISPN